MFRTVVSRILKQYDLSKANHSVKRFAGHSKWQNIRHIKGQKDAERALMFTKLSRMMKAAVIEGGGQIDPKVNLKLSHLIEQAKRASMPATTLQSILKSCVADKSQAKTHIFEIKGPGSCFILCEVITPHVHSLKQSIATVLKKHSYGDGGGMHSFLEKGIVEAQIDNNKTGSDLVEFATDHAIESGAEDVTILEENILQFTCGKTNLNVVVQQLEKFGYKILEASVEYIPVLQQNLSDTDLEICKKLYDKLETFPEVIRLSDNIA